MTAERTGLPDQAWRAQALASDPEAGRWAQICAWVPGTGHCRSRGCDAACVFRAQRDAETRRVERSRRLRRIFQR